MTFANVKTIPASTTGGQQGVIAKDRRLRRAGAQEGLSLTLKLTNMKNAPSKNSKTKIYSDIWHTD